MEWNDATVEVATRVYMSKKYTNVASNVPNPFEEIPF